MRGLRLGALVVAAIGSLVVLVGPADAQTTTTRPPATTTTTVQLPPSIPVTPATGSAGLADTGFNADVLVGLGLGLIGAGSVMNAATRRRRSPLRIR